MDAMLHAHSERVREQMWRMRATMASDMSNDTASNNAPVIRRILQLRHDKARAAGYANYSDMTLRYKMAGSTERVRGFLEQVLREIEPLFKKEYEELLAFVGGDARALASAHLLFHERRFVESRGDDNREEEGGEERNTTTPDNGMERIFTVAQSLLGIKCDKVSGTAAEHIGRWHPDVEVYRVSDETSDETRGYIYCDLYERPDKDASASVCPWVAKIQSRSRLFPDQAHSPDPLRLPMISLCASAPSHLAPTRRLPLDRVSDIFHELGHALHYVLSEAEDAACGYEELEWDAVEIPSYFMEHWAKDADALREVVGEAASQRSASVARAGRLRKASEIMRQLQYALVDNGHQPRALTSAPPLSKSRVTASA